MTNDEIINFQTQWIELLQNRFDMNRAVELEQSIRRWYRSCSGLQLSSVLQYLNVRASLYLNLPKLQEAKASIYEFQCYETGMNIHNLTVIKNRQLEAEYLSRCGKVNAAIQKLTILYDKVKDDIPHSLAADILRLKGELKTTLHQPDINTLCKALGEAEASEDTLSIIKSYNELGRLLATKYPALGLSLQWKSQVKSDEINNEYQKYLSIFYRAKTEIQLYSRYHPAYKIADLFLCDAVKTMKAIDRETLPNEVLKASYDETYGYVMGDVNAMERALNFFKDANAHGKVYENAWALAFHYQINSDSVNRKKMLNICEQAARAMGNQEMLKDVWKAQRQK